MLASTIGSDRSAVAPANAEVRFKMLLHVAPFERNTSAHLVVGQDAALHPVVDGAQFLFQPPRDLGFVDELLRLDAVLLTVLSRILCRHKFVEIALLAACTMRAVRRVTLLHPLRASEHATPTH